MSSFAGLGLNPTSYAPRRIGVPSGELNVRPPAIQNVPDTGLAQAGQAVGQGVQNLAASLHQIRSELARAEQRRALTDLDQRAYAITTELIEANSTEASTTAALDRVEEAFETLRGDIDDWDQSVRPDAEQLIEGHFLSAVRSARVTAARNGVVALSQSIATNRDRLTSNIYSGTTSLTDARERWDAMMDRHAVDLGEAKIEELTAAADALFANSHWRRLLDAGDPLSMEAALEFLTSEAARDAFDGQQLATLRRETIQRLTAQLGQYARQHNADAVEVIAEVLEAAGPSQAITDAIASARNTLAFAQATQRVADVEQFAATTKDTVRHLLRINDAPALRELHDQLADEAPPGITASELKSLQTYVKRQIVEAQHGQRHTHALLEFLQTGKGEVDARWRNEAVENAAWDMALGSGIGEHAAAAAFVSRLGYAPAAYIRAMDRAAAPDTSDPQWLLESVRMLDGVNPRMLNRLSSSRPTISVLAEVTRGLDADDPAAVQAATLIADPEAAAAMADARSILRAPLPTDAGPLSLRAGGDARPRGGAQMIHGDIIDAVGIQTRFVTPDMIRRYEANFQLHFAEATKIMPTATRDRQIVHARQKAREALLGRHIGVLGVPLSTSALAMPDHLAGDPIMHRWIGEATDHFANIIADDGLGSVAPELTVAVNGRSYIPAGNGLDGLSHVLEVNPLTMQYRVITSEAGSPGIESDPVLFGQIERIIGGEITPEQFTRHAPLLWRQGYIERSIEGYDTRYHAQLGLAIYRAAIDEWTDLHGFPPPVESPDFRAFADEFVRQLGWDGWGNVESRSE